MAALYLKFSIIGIREIWGTIQKIDVQNNPGYSHEYCIRTSSNRGGGVSLYLKKSISYKVRTKLVFQSIDFELLVIEFDKKKNFYQEKHYCMYFFADLQIHL